MNIKHYPIFVLLITILATLSSHLSAQELSLEQEWLIKAQIKELVDSYAINRDNDDAEGYANTFAEDGTLTLYGIATSGRKAIADKVLSAGTTGVRMHIMSSSFVEVIDSKNARGTHYATVYSVQKPEGYKEGDLIPTSNFRVMGKYHDRYVLTNDGWKFAERELEAIFSPAE